ncbi:MAG: hypothetical protein AB7E72_02420 [Lysobacterales bacterium]
MNRRLQTGLLGLSGILLLLSALAHALAGWPSMARGLFASDAPAELIAALRVGWYFGSAAMLAFAAIALHGAYAVWRAQPAPLTALRLIALTYLGLGLAAFVYRDFNSHFLAFMVLGALLLAAASGRQSASESRGSGKRSQL